MHEKKTCGEEEEEGALTERGGGRRRRRMEGDEGMGGDQVEGGKGMVQSLMAGTEKKIKH